MSLADEGHYNFRIWVTYDDVCYGTGMGVVNVGMKVAISP